MGTRVNIRNPRRARKNVTAKIQNVKTKLQTAKEAGKKKRVKKLRGRVKTLKEKRQNLTEKIQTQKATTKVTSITPTVRGGGNQARNTLSALQKRVRTSNLGIRNNNPLGNN